MCQSWGWIVHPQRIDQKSANSTKIWGKQSDGPYEALGIEVQLKQCKTTGNGM
jgi:hypothetical protein